MIGASAIAAGPIAADGGGALSGLLADGYLAVPGPLGAPALVGVAPVQASLAAESPLGLPVLVAQVLPPPAVEALLSVPGPLGAPALLALHDFTGLLGDAVTVYVMALATPGGAVRVPVSSWQATLQMGSANYVQCVVPACAPWLVALGESTEFVIYRQALLPGGEVLAHEMARAPTEQLTYDRGPERYTCTMSGYSPGFAEALDPPAVFDRALTGVRSVSSGTGGMRVRCAVDWLLRPGHRAFVDGVPLLVAYINYYAPTGFDAYMDVGSRA